MAAPVTAALLIIGDEILSGRTRDANLSHISIWLNDLGIDMKECRIVPDIEDEIVAALNDLRTRFTYVFTTGGIGPTHDDITADAIARAFGVGISHRADAVAVLEAQYKPEDRTDARMRMARIPDGAILIDNPVSIAPGFQVDNVFTMAGVPVIMQAMLESVRHRLAGGTPVETVTIKSNGLEGDIAKPLGGIQNVMGAAVSIGSYPFRMDGKFGTRIVLRGRDSSLLAAATRDVEAMMSALELEFSRET